MTVSHVRTQKHKNADFCPEQFPRTGRRVPHSRHQSARLVACGVRGIDVKSWEVSCEIVLDLWSFWHLTMSGKAQKGP